MESALGLTVAPVFFPTSEEFQSPMAYIAKIRPQAEPFGMCKIVPPKDWAPSFSLATQVSPFEVSWLMLSRRNFAFKLASSASMSSTARLDSRKHFLKVGLRIREKLMERIVAIPCTDGRKSDSNASDRLLFGRFALAQAPS
jgi:hypothetical protein